MKSGRIAARRILFAALGMLSVTLGIVGVFVPGLPTTVFVIAASYLFARSSPTLERWLEGNRWLGPLAAPLQGDQGHAAQEQDARARFDVDGYRPQHPRLGDTRAGRAGPGHRARGRGKRDAPLLRAHDGRTTVAHPVVAVGPGREEWTYQRPRIPSRHRHTPR